MNSITKKVARLSPVAQDILNTVNTRYSHASYSAAEYIVSSVNRGLESLTLYDMAKLGREFYARTEDVNRVPNGYGVFEKFKGEQREKKESRRNPSHRVSIGGVSESPGKNLARMEALTEARDIISSYEQASEDHDRIFEPTAHDLRIIARNFQDAGHFKEALEYYQRGYVKTVGVEREKYNFPDFVRGISEVQSLIERMGAAKKR
jgi:hypothetical protein